MTENLPYKGIKGKGEATILKVFEIMSKVEKINLKYLDTLDHLLAKMLIENTRNGIETVPDITPRFFSDMGFGKT